MGKRSTFERQPRDFYPTPLAAVLPLLPHLPDRFTFIEPMAGNGALVDHLTRAGGSCAMATDIVPQRSDITTADGLTCDWPEADFIVTNPPWRRPILHALIARLDRPAWLLFDADWMHTRQAAPMLPRLRQIVSVGRVKWIEGSPHTGKDNCCWHRFDVTEGPAVFHGRCPDPGSTCGRVIGSGGTT